MQKENEPTFLEKPKKKNKKKAQKAKKQKRKKDKTKQKNAELISSLEHSNIRIKKNIYFEKNVKLIKKTIQKYLQKKKKKKNKFFFTFFIFF